MSILTALSAFVSFTVLPVSNCVAHDADTMRCEGVPVPIRFAGIDAPEIGRCARFKVCVPGDGAKSRDALIKILGRGKITVQQIQIPRPSCQPRFRLKRDQDMAKYGQTHLDCYSRRIDVVLVDGKVVQCELLARGLVAYRWDHIIGGEPYIASLCGEKAISRGIKIPPRVK
jgi:endonuclease YncB( thermonuclease family)